MVEAPKVQAQNILSSDDNSNLGNTLFLPQIPTMEQHIYIENQKYENENGFRDPINQLRKQKEDIKKQIRKLEHMKTPDKSWINSPQNPHKSKIPNFSPNQKAYNTAHRNHILKVPKYQETERAREQTLYIDSNNQLRELHDGGSEVSNANLRRVKSRNRHSRSEQ